MGIEAEHSPLMERINQRPKIHFIITGGTMDSHWDGKIDSAVPNAQSYLPEYFSLHAMYADFKFTEVCLKDSRSLTGEDTENVLKAIEESDADKIIVTHGTYTMPDTARFLEANLKRKDQVVILTGSYTPLRGFTDSDAPFNLGFAVMATKVLDPGVYIAMNGRIFTPSEVAKRLAEGTFYSVYDRKELGQTS